MDQNSFEPFFWVWSLNINTKTIGGEVMNSLLTQVDAPEIPYFSMAHSQSPLNQHSHKFSIGHYPRCSMYGIFTYIYHQNYPKVGK